MNERQDRSCRPRRLSIVRMPAWLRWEGARFGDAIEDRPDGYVLVRRLGRSGIEGPIERAIVAGLLEEDTTTVTQGAP